VLIEKIPTPFIKGIGRKINEKNYIFSIPVSHFGIEGFKCKV